MIDYYIYQVDMDGCVATASLACCTDDAAACVEALRVADGYAQLEVWAGFRWVATWAPRKRWLH